jgi:hypothetical protein
MSASVVVIPPEVVVVSPTSGPRVLCTISYTFAIYYLILGALLIIVPWGLSSLYSLGSACATNVMGILLFVAALAQIAYISRIVREGRRCVCP